MGSTAGRTDSRTPRLRFGLVWNPSLALRAGLEPLACASGWFGTLACASGWFGTLARASGWFGTPRLRFGLVWNPRLRFGLVGTPTIGHTRAQFGFGMPRQRSSK